MTFQISNVIAFRFLKVYNLLGIKVNYFLNKINVGKVSFSFILLTPLLWWPHNIGTPNLYNFSVSITNGKDNIDQRNVTFGIRTVKLLYDIDEGKPSSMFLFEVNGFKIFAKGANYVPHNYFIT